MVHSPGRGSPFYVMRSGVKIRQVFAIHLLPLVLAQRERFVFGEVEIPLFLGCFLYLPHLLLNIPPEFFAIHGPEQISAHGRSGAVQLPRVHPVQRRASIRDAHFWHFFTWNFAQEPYVRSSQTRELKAIPPKAERIAKWTRCTHNKSVKMHVGGQRERAGRNTRERSSKQRAAPISSRSNSEEKQTSHSSRRAPNMAIASKRGGKKIDSEGYLNRRRFPLAGERREPPTAERAYECWRRAPFDWQQRLFKQKRLFIGC